VKAIKTSLYEQDFVLWTEKPSRLIANGDLEAIDWENIEEKILALGRSERQQLENRLEVLLEHLLKWCYVDSAYDNRLTFIRSFQYSYSGNKYYIAHATFLKVG